MIASGIKLELAQEECGHWSNELATSKLLDNSWQSGQDCMIWMSNAFHSENMMPQRRLQGGLWRANWHSIS